MAKIAMLIGEEFEDVEAKAPLDALREAGHAVDLVGAQAEQTVEGKRGTVSLTTAHAAGEVNAADYDALVIPGGHGPDNLRIDGDAVDLTRDFASSGKIIAAICHGPQLLIEAGVVRGRRVTSWPSVRTDLRNAGAVWVDEQVVTDGNLITSRKPADLDAFNNHLLGRLSS